MQIASAVAETALTGLAIGTSGTALVALGITLTLGVILRAFCRVFPDLADPSYLPILPLLAGACAISAALTGFLILSSLFLWLWKFLGFLPLVALSLAGVNVAVITGVTGILFRLGKLSQRGNNHSRTVFRRKGVERENPERQKSKGGKDF